MDDHNILAVASAPAQTITLTFDPMMRAAIADLTAMIGNMYGEIQAQTQILQRLEEHARQGVPLTQPEINADQARYDEMARQAADLLTATAGAGMPTASDLWASVANVDPETVDSTLAGETSPAGAVNRATEASTPTAEQYAALENVWYWPDPNNQADIWIREWRDTLDENGKQIGVEDLRPATQEEKRIIAYFNQRRPGSTRGGRSRPKKRT